METGHREKLRKHRMDLSENMDSEIILSKLIDAKILTVVDKEIVLSQNSTLKQNEKILDFIPKRGPKAFQGFVDVLKNSNQKELSLLLTMDEEEFDTLDGPVAVDHDEKSVADKDVPPTEKYKRSEDSLDGRPTQQIEANSEDEVVGMEIEDGRFGLGSKKKAEVTDMDSPKYFCAVDPEYCYSMTTVPRGYFLLINNKDFLPESGMEPYTRNGTDADAEAMKKLFEDLGFVVDEHRNVKVEDMLKLFKKAGTMDYSKYSAFAGCVLSHGQEGILYGVDGTLDIRDLTAYFRGSNLAGKPKMFFFQACQGSEYMDGVEPATVPGADETDGPPVYGNDISLPTESDFVYAYSTVPGYYSWRNSTKGSWFIQGIVQVFRKYAHKMDVVRMLTRVNFIVSSKKSQTGQRLSHHKRQISSIITQLRKDLYLCPVNGPLKELKSIAF